MTAAGARREREGNEENAAEGEKMKQEKKTGTSSRIPSWLLDEGMWRCGRQGSSDTGKMRTGDEWQYTHRTAGIPSTRRRTRLRPDRRETEEEKRRARIAEARVKGRSLHTRAEENACRNFLEERGRGTAASDRRLAESPPPSLLLLPLMRRVHGAHTTRTCTAHSAVRSTNVDNGDGRGDEEERGSADEALGSGDVDMPRALTDAEASTYLQLLSGGEVLVEVQHEEQLARAMETAEASVRPTARWRPEALSRAMTRGNMDAEKTGTAIGTRTRLVMSSGCGRGDTGSYGTRPHARSRSTSGIKPSSSVSCALIDGFPLADGPGSSYYIAGSSRLLTRRKHYSSSTIPVSREADTNAGLHLLPRRTGVGRVIGPSDTDNDIDATVVVAGDYATRRDVRDCTKSVGSTRIGIKGGDDNDYEDAFYSAFFRGGRHSATASCAAFELETRLEEAPPSLPSCTWSRHSSTCRPECSSSSESHLLHHQTQHQQRQYAHQPDFVWHSRSAHGAHMPTTDGCVIRPRLVRLDDGHGIGDEAVLAKTYEDAHQRTEFETISKPFRFYGGYLVSRI